MTTFSFRTSPSEAVLCDALAMPINLKYDKNFLNMSLKPNAYDITTEIFFMKKADPASRDQPERNIELLNKYQITLKSLK